MDMVEGYWTSQIVLTAARLGLADHLADGPRQVADLARTAEADENAVWRLLRACAALGLTEETEPGRFVLTETGRGLRSGELRDFAIGFGNQGLYRTFGALYDSVRNGRPEGATALGTEIYEYLGEHPEERAAFGSALGKLAGRIVTAVPDLVDLSATSRIVDIGGGTGALLAALLARAPHATGVLLDRPGAVLPEPDRIEVVGGDFHQAVPAGDLYLIMRVLHNWDDERALRILGNCRAAGGPASRLLVVEQLREDRPSRIDLLDLVMLVNFGGRIRSRVDYEKLLATANYRVERVTKVADPYAPWSVIEAVTVDS